MPLRDHFRSPLDDEAAWEGFHGQWPAMIVIDLANRLPPGYVAAPRVHSGAFVEIDVATYEKDFPDVPAGRQEPNGGVATAVWTPPRATFAVAADLPAQDEYEVRVYDRRRGRRLVAAVEIVSPANKDRLEHRRAFVAKCAALLQKRVSVVLVDLVTTRHFNLYRDLLELMSQNDPSLEPDAPALYAAACRATRKNREWLVEAWFHRLQVGRSLPTLPLWLSDDLAIPLELETSYEETCRVLRLPVI
jgi:Protein of unknown function (DUF4058)